MAKMTIRQGAKLPKEADVVRFEMLENFINSNFKEMKEFSEKKPDELLNKFKVTSLNKILEPIKELLSGEPTASFLSLLDENAFTSYSDSILIIAQFQCAMAQFKNSYYGWGEPGYRWFTIENP